MEQTESIEAMLRLEPQIIVKHLQQDNEDIAEVPRTKVCPLG